MNSPAILAYRLRLQDSTTGLPANLINRLGKRDRADDTHLQQQEGAHQNSAYQ